MMRFLSAALLATACAAPAPQPTGHSPTEATAARAVKVPPAAAEFVGVVTSRKSSVISSQVQAPLIKLNVHAGQLIKAGELVAQLDETEIRTRYEQAKGNEQAAQMEAGAYGAQIANLRAKANASSHLHDLKIEPRMAVNTAMAELRQAMAQAAAAGAKASAARAAREQAEKDLTKAQILSPLTGIVTNIKAREGEVTQIGTPLARVFDPSDLIIRFAVPREHRGELRRGQRVELAVEGNQRPVWATVTNISGAQEPPINFTVVEADIDDTKLAAGEITVASVGRVRIADARGAKR
jgi:RND family efflux transporter MFP subunit